MVSNSVSEQIEMLGTNSPDQIVEARNPWTDFVLPEVHTQLKGHTPLLYQSELNVPVDTQNVTDSIPQEKEEYVGIVLFFWGEAPDDVFPDVLRNRYHPKIHDTFHHYEVFEVVLGHR